MSTARSARRRQRLHWVWASAGLAAIIAAAPTEARVTRIVIDAVTPLAGQAIAYEEIRGRAFGELDPADPHNGVITDITLGTDADGKVRYETSFNLVKPLDKERSSGFLWHDVPNRGGAGVIAVEERGLGDIGLTITDLALGAKAEIDKIREQSLNLE